LYQVGVKLKPAAMRSLLGLPPGQLTNCLVHARDVGGHALAELAEQLYGAASEDRQGQLLDNFFGQKLGSGGEADAVTGQAVHRILDQKGILRVDELKSALGIDYRTLERRFKTTTGLTPKEFARIIRFKNAYKAFRGRQASNTFFFLDCGYYDQSHYIREFKHFMGGTPGAFHAGLTPVSDAILRQGLA
jgi:AraC-like DNA-binding protein